MLTQLKEQAKGAVMFMLFILIFGTLAIARVETCTGAIKCLTNATIPGNLTVEGNLTINENLFIEGNATGINPSLPEHLTTKEYVDVAVAGLHIDYFCTNTTSDVTNYYVIQDSETGEAESIITSAALNAGNDQLIFNFTTNASLPFNTIQAGIYDGHFHLEKTGGAAKTVTVYWKLFHRISGGTETELLQGETSGEVTSAEGYDLHGVLSAPQEFTSTDRLVIKLYANAEGGGATAQVKLYMEGTTNSHVSARVETETLNNIFLRQDGTKNATGDFTFNKNVTIIGTLKGDSPVQVAGGLNLTDGNYYGDGSLITGIALQEAYDSDWVNVVGNTSLTFTHSIGGDISDYNVKIEIRENGTEELNPETGMIGLWHFNENSGSVAFDATLNNNNGVINETCWVASKPVLRKALRFDNGSDTVGFGNIASFEYDDAFSLQAWIKTTGSPITQYVISKASFGSTKRGWTFYILKTGELGSFLSSDLGNLNNLNIHDNSSVDDDEWHHIALTYDGSSDASGVLLYVDGKTSGNKTTTINNLTGTMIIGESLQVSGYGGAHNIFSGIIDEVSVWNVTLTPAQVEENYNTTVTQYKIFEDYYQLNNTEVNIDTIDYPDRDLKVRVWVGQ